MHHRLASGKMTFHLEHMCPNCKLVMNKETPHDQFLTCNKMLETQTKLIATVVKLLQKWHTPPQLRNKIIENLRTLYEMDPILDSLYLHSTETKQTSESINKIVASQSEIGWKHFIRGRISKTFKPQLSYYFKTNKLGNRYYVQSWYSKVIAGLWSIHLTKGRHFSSAIYGGDNKSKDKATIKPTLLKIERKYYIASKPLPKYKKICFRRDITKYKKISIYHLRKWIRTARDILKRFQLNKRKKENQRQIQYNSIGHRVHSTNTVGRIPLIHNIVKISPIVFKRKQATLNLLLLNKTKATSTEISPSNKPNHIAKQTVIIINPETTLPSLHNSKKNNNTVSIVMYKQ